MYVAIHGVETPSLVSIFTMRLGLPRSHMRAERHAELALPAGMRLQGDDHGPLGRNQPPDPVEGLAQERSRPEQRRKLLGPLVATQVSGPAGAAGSLPGPRALRPREIDARPTRPPLLPALAQSP